MGAFNCPVIGARKTCDFGWRPDPFNKQTGKFWHQGVDLASPTPGKKVPIYASADGVVKKAGVLSTYGNRVLITHTINGKTMETLYAHLDSIAVKEGKRVKQGEYIGIMGMTGSSTAVHLHFEIHQGVWAPGQPNAIDPMRWIQLTTCKPLTQNASTQTPSVDWTKKVGYKVAQNSNAFRIHTDAFPNKKIAENAAKDLVRAKYLSYGEVFGNDKDGYRVQSGKYTSQKAAEQASKKLLENRMVGYCSIIGTKE